MNRHRLFLATLAVLVTALAGLGLHGAHSARLQRSNEQAAAQQLAAALQLTDLALWSEARYTRHPSQADLFTPFQDFPGAPEHFPAGSLLGPEQLRRSLTAAAVER